MDDISIEHGLNLQQLDHLLALSLVVSVVQHLRQQLGSRVVVLDKAVMRVVDHALGSAWVVTHNGNSGHNVHEGFNPGVCAGKGRASLETVEAWVPHPTFTHTSNNVNPGNPPAPPSPALAGAT